jgi:hypothetical protein
MEKESSSAVAVSETVNLSTEQTRDRTESVVSIDSSLGNESGTGRKKEKKQRRRGESLTSMGSSKGTDSSCKGTPISDEQRPMRQYGQVTMRAKIKKGNIHVPSGTNLEDVGSYVEREIMQSKHEAHSAPMSEQQQAVADLSRRLHDELLETHVRSEGFDRFDSQYDPHADLMMSASFARVRSDEIRAENDHGTSLSKERFSAKYWGTWRNDVMILEKISAEEAVAQKPPPSKHEVLAAKKKSMVQQVQRCTPSLLPGTSFGLPRTERSEFFDFHMQGNRNSTTKLYEGSLGTPVPKAFHTPSALLPADSDPDRFGHSMPGGVIAMGPARGVSAKMPSANIDFPPVDVPKGDAKLLSFGTSARSAPVRRAINSSSEQGGGGGNPIVNESTMPGNKFGSEARTGGIPDTRRSYPGPATYDVPGVFDRFELPDYKARIDNIAKSGADFRAIPAHDLAKLGGFAFGCNRQEHVLYGFCLDGRCSKRIEFERAFLQTKDFARLGAETLEQCTECLPGRDKAIKKKSAKTTVADDKPPELDIFNIDGEAALARLEAKYSSPERSTKLRREFILSLVPDPKEYIYPLHMAASRADLNALRKMRALGLDINLRQGDRDETPIHLAVRNQHLKAVNAIVDIFEGVVDLNIQNKLGDAPLHLAARKGFKDIVEALCDADANPLLKNDAGLTPLQEAKVFGIQQLLRLQEDIFKLRMELSETADAVGRARRKAAQQRAMASEGVELAAYLAEEGLSTSADISEADRIQFPWRAQIASRGGGTAPSSRVSSTRSRSRIMEITKDKFDAEADKAQTNTSLYRVARTKTKLKDPTQNSFVMGYWGDETSGK